MSEKKTKEKPEAEVSAGRGWHGGSEGHAAAGRKGGSKVSQNREHMAEIGRRGGQAVSADREHMARIGRMGGRMPKHKAVPDPKVKAKP